MRHQDRKEAHGQGHGLTTRFSCSPHQLLQPRWWQEVEGAGSETLLQGFPLLLTLSTSYPKISYQSRTAKKKKRKKFFPAGV